MNHTTPTINLDPRALDDHAGESRARRDILRWLGAGATASLLAGCGGGSDSSTSTTTTTTSTTTTTTTTTSGSCAAQPGETNGPYPADGTSASGQTLNALALAGFARSDIRQSVGGASGTASGTALGTPMTLKLRVVNTNASCAALTGYSVYVWHCTRDGLYSLYSTGVTSENYLRGLQSADANGDLTFTTIFPGCYNGRWPHIHFEVYANESTATTSPAGDWRLVSQIAMPEDVCRTVYAQSSYGSSLSALNGITLARDNVFSDGVTTQMSTVTGSIAGGYTATLTIGLAV